MIIMFTSVLMMMLVSQVCSSPVHLAKPFIHDEINSQAGFPATLSFSIRYVFLYIYCNMFFKIY